MPTNGGSATSSCGTTGRSCTGRGATTRARCASCTAPPSPTAPRLWNRRRRNNNASTRRTQEAGRGRKGADPLRPPRPLGDPCVTAQFLGETRHGYRRGDVLYRLFDGGGRPGARMRSARFRIAVGSRAFAHPGFAAVAVSVGGRPAEAVLRRDGPVRVARRRRGGDADHARQRGVPGHPARSDPDGQAGRLARPDFRRPLSVRRRRRLERRRDGRSRHRLQHPLQADARAHRGDEGDLDGGHRRIPRRDGRFRPASGLAEAGAEALPAGHRRRHVPARGAAGAALRRRLDSAFAPAAIRGRDRLPAAIPADGGGSRPRPCRGAGDGVGRGARPRPHPALPRPGRGARRRQPAGRGCRQDAAAARRLGPDHPHSGGLSHEPRQSIADPDRRDRLGRHRRRRGTGRGRPSRAARLRARTAAAPDRRLSGPCRPRRVARRGPADRARRPDRLFRGGRAAGPRQAGGDAEGRAVPPRLNDQADRLGGGDDAGRGRPARPARAGGEIPARVQGPQGRGRTHRPGHRQDGAGARATAPADDGAGSAAPHLGTGVRPQRRRAGLPGLPEGRDRQSRRHARRVRRQAGPPAAGASARRGVGIRRLDRRARARRRGGLGPAARRLRRRAHRPAARHDGDRFLCPPGEPLAPRRGAEAAAGQRRADAAGRDEQAEFPLGRRRAGGERGRLPALCRDAAQPRRIRQNTAAGAAYRRADDRRRAAAGDQIRRSGGALRRHRADPGNGPGLRPRLCRAHRRRTQPAARLGRHVLLDGGVGHHILGRPARAPDRDPDDPDADGQRRTLSPGVPRADLCGADRVGTGALRRKERDGGRTLTGGGSRTRLHPRHRRRRPGRRPGENRGDPVSARAQRLSPYRPRQVDLPEFRHRRRVRRALPPALRRHQPTKEEREYIEAIERDVRWLGYDWGPHLYHASDYFERLYEWAEHLIRNGDAYVDDTPPDQMRAMRGTLTEPGTNSPYRDRSPAENLDLFRRMRAGEFPNGARVLRAKIDMAAGNINLRDPVLYRILHAEHPRTGRKWSIYPTYDFAHGQSDAIEGVTHSICTLEFEDHRPLYDWLIAHLPVPSRPRQYEFARLSLSYTVLSKRFLTRLVQEGRVSGWDDPRMPTLAGLRRRGVPAAAIREFARRLGVARANSVVDIAQFEHAVRDELNRTAPRRMAVLRPLKLIIDNYPAGRRETVTARNHPDDEAAGTRELPFGRELYIERDDFREEAPNNYYRLTPGREVRLRYAYLVTCGEAVRDAAGDIVELHCTYDPASRGGNAPDGRRVRGTIHWVSAADAAAAEVRLYNPLFIRPDPGADGDLLADLNPESIEVLRDCRVEPALAAAAPESPVQFERLGYFCRDPDAGLVFNRTIGLRDSYAKAQAGG